MFIDSPRRTLALAKSTDDTTADGIHFQIGLRRKFATFFIEHRDAVSTAHDYEQAAEFLTEITELAFSAAQVEALLSLYPHARIKLAVESVLSADTREQLSFAAAHFFLGCSWPSIGDDVDTGAFIDLLRRQALLMGFVAAHRSGVRVSELLEVALGQMWRDLTKGRGCGEVIEIDLVKKRARLLFQHMTGPKAWVPLLKLQNSRGWELVRSVTR